MKPPLEHADKMAISSLSRAAVEQTAAGLLPTLKKSLWLEHTNHYTNDVVGQLSNGTPNTAAQKQDLAKYICASVVLHASDGWSYLGRATAAILAGDLHRGLHLAYYAELRAAMSLLGSAGIGIFDHNHYIVSAVNSTRKLNTRSGTHQLAWAALEHWAQQSSSGDLFAKLVRPEGIALETWFFPVGGVSAFAAQAQKWFIQWGMDLKLAGKDRAARNSSSYRPDGIPKVWDVPASGAVSFVRDMWLALEPNSTSSFSTIDRHILRLAAERHFTGISGSQPSKAGSTFLAYIKKMVEPQGLEKASEDRMIRFLLRQQANKDPDIFAQSAQAPSNTGNAPLAVLSRAVLLLRIATGAAQSLLVTGGIRADALKFWWTQIGEARGLWAPGSPPDNLSDLWIEISDSLDEIERSMVATPNMFATRKNVAFDEAPRLGILSSHERVGLWGLCPA